MYPYLIMPYATLDMLKQRARIIIGDTSQDANLNAKNTQAAREIDFTLKYHGVGVPVTEPAELLNQLGEVNADLAVGLFWEEVGPMMQAEAIRMIQRGREGLQKVLDLLVKGGTLVIG